MRCKDGLFGVWGGRGGVILRVHGVILQAPLHSPGTEHFPSPSLISSQRKYLPQVNTTPRPLSHPLSAAPVLEPVSVKIRGLALDRTHYTHTPPCLASALSPLTFRPRSSNEPFGRSCPCCSFCTTEDIFLPPPPPPPLLAPHPSVSNLILSTYHQV